MQVLNKILEEIDKLDDPYYKDYVDRKHVKEIILSHMDGATDTKDSGKIEEINKEMEEYLFEKYCIEGFDEELDKIFQKYLEIGKDMNVFSKCFECGRRKWYQKGYGDGGIDPVSKEFLKDCADTAKRYKRSDSNWIPVKERLPEPDNYVLLSFDNFSLVDIGRYEVGDDGGGAFYPGGEDTSYSSIGLFVNAWRPLPEPYKR